RQADLKSLAAAPAMRIPLVFGNRVCAAVDGHGDARPHDLPRGRHWPRPCAARPGVAESSSVGHSRSAPRGLAAGVLRAPAASSPTDRSTTVIIRPDRRSPDVHLLTEFGFDEPVTGAQFAIGQSLNA